MDKFESPSLHRVFDTVYMGTLAGAAPAAPAPMAADAPDEKIEKAPGASTVAELFARKGQFKDGTVTVKGKVVKYNEAILGKNWLHLRDGSGTLAAKDNDITVTTKTPAKVGDVVTAKGVLRLDKDFGAGYVYTVMIEDASIVK